jgi:hypothetical protein
MNMTQRASWVDSPVYLMPLVVCFIAAMIFPAVGFSATGHDHQAIDGQALPGWAEQLKGQTIVENTMEGAPERTAMMERQHHRVMEQMQRDADSQRTDGFYNNANTAPAIRTSC